MRHWKVVAVVLVPLVALCVAWQVSRHHVDERAQHALAYEVFWAGEDPAQAGQAVKGCAAPVRVTLAANTGATYDLYQGLTCHGEFTVGSRGVLGHAGSPEQDALTGRSGRAWPLTRMGTGEDVPGVREGVIESLNSGRRSWVDLSCNDQYCGSSDQPGPWRSGTVSGERVVAVRPPASMGLACSKIAWFAVELAPAPGPDWVEVPRCPEAFEVGSQVDVRVGADGEVQIRTHTPAVK